MKLIDLLLLAALMSLCACIGLVAPHVGLAVSLFLFAPGACALWYFLGDEDEG